MDLAQNKSKQNQRRKSVEGLDTLTDLLFPLPVCNHYSFLFQQKYQRSILA